MNFCERLKEIRVEHGLNQRALAELSGLSPQSISSFESGINSPTMPSLCALANALNVSTDYLLGRSDELGGVVVPPHGTVSLSEEEDELLRLFRNLGRSRKEDLMIYLRALSGVETISEKKKA